MAHSQNKLQNLYLFYTNSTSKDQAKNFLTQNNISYVVFGKEEKELNKASLKEKPNELNYEFLSPVFTNSNVIIFSVK